MTREMRELNVKLAEAERAVKAALELRDVETAEALMEDVRALRKQVADLETQETKAKQEPLTGYRIAGSDGPASSLERVYTSSPVMSVIMVCTLSPDNGYTPAMR
jgi:hypothetical protein